ncbi:MULTISPECIES: hypothetical protein [unclassified Sphingobacterium]|jgi:gas vesicle protein|uniref:hypothetical protein n=1 Tax=unclassified Sphingobacterium TaxID=2609468 RepID=UPI0025DFB01F|nr:MULTISPECIES: hypothetical protein [unclassified Sphingobacterium]MDF2479352.1 hypothetical protein [Sphingobacterium sp.]
MKNSKNGLVAFALVGLAAGAAAWYLLGTDDGKKQLDRANDGIKSLTKSLKDLSKKEARKAQKLANRASAELDNLKSKAQAAFSKATDDADALKNKAKEAGREALDHANNAAQNLASKIDNTTDAAKSKISNT